MIRQIWKVRNTDGDPVEKSPPATQETSAAQVTTDDESARGTVNNPRGEEHPQAEGVRDIEAKASEQQARTALLTKASGAALSVCTFDPKSATLYALAEQSAANKAPNSSGPTKNEEEIKQGAPSTTKALPGILSMPAALTVAV